jgi:hypothetical protein
MSGTDVNVGYDYHLAEVRRNERGDAATGREVRYQAYCDACGWIGGKRDTRSAADDDAAAHDEASNPPSNR